jgi:nitrous oxide reductase
MSDQRLENGRRRFLKTAALAGSAATVAAAAGAAVADAELPVDPAEPARESAAKQGYQVTPHVETYYRLARQ